MKKLFSAVLASLLILSSFTFTFAVNAAEGDTSVIVGTNSIKGLLATSGIKSAAKVEVLSGENAIDGYDCVKINPDPCTDRQPPIWNGENLVVLENSISGYSIDTSKYNWVRVMYKYVPAEGDTTEYKPYFTFRSDSGYNSGNITADAAYTAGNWSYMDFDISSLATTEPGTLQYYRYYAFGTYAGTQQYSESVNNTTPDTWKTDTNKKLANPDSTVYIASMTFFTQEEQPGLPAVTGISFAESEIEIERGYSYPLPAVTVSGVYGYNTGYSILMDGHASANTRLLDGTIIIGDDETAEYFTITAIANGDETKTAELKVNVKQPAPRTPFDAENVLIRFGVVSDVHQNGYYAGKGNSSQVQEWVHAIDVMQQIAKDDGAKLDAILVAGDMVDGVANGGSNVGSFNTNGDKAIQNMREVGHFAKGVWGSDNGVEFTGEKKVIDETSNGPNGYLTATSVKGFGNGFDATTKLFYCLGNHDESGRGVANPKETNTIDGQALKFSNVYSADYFAAVICGWHHNPDSDEAKANSRGGTGTYQDGFEHSYRQYIADLIDYNTNPATTVTQTAFEAAYGVKLDSADALFDKYYGHLDVKTTLTDKDNGISYGNMHMVIDPNPDNATADDRIHFIAVELSQANESCAWAEEIIKTSVAEDPSKPVFIISHYKPKGTMYGDTNYTRLSDVIKNYPQAIIWGGHSHTSMHNDNAINSELGFVAVETNTTRYMGTSTALTLEAMFGAGTANSTKYPQTPYNYPKHEANVSNANYVEVDKNNNVRIRRVDLYRSYSTDFAANPTFYTADKYTTKFSEYNEEFVPVDEPVFIRDPWDITDIETGKHLNDFNTTVRTEKTSAPYFESESSLSAKGIIGGLEVNFKMNAKDDGMIMLYVLEVKDSANTVVHRRYYTNFYYEYPQNPTATYAGNNIAEREIKANITCLEPSTEYTVELFSMDDFYVKGETISTKATSSNGKLALDLADGRTAVFVDTTGERLSYVWTDNQEYLVHTSFAEAIATGADVIYLIKSPHVTNSLRDNVVNKQTKALEIVGVADNREDTVLSWANATYISTYDLTLTNVALNKEGSGDCALHVYNGHTLTLNDCLATGYALNIFTANANNSKTGNLKITGDTGDIANIWTNGTYDVANSSVIGDVTLTLEGGVYSKDVHFMKVASQATENPYNQLDGNLYINVSGGTFEKALRGSTPDKRAVITKNSVVNVTGGTIAQLGNTGTSYVKGKEIYIITDAVLAKTTYTASKDASGNTKSILITVPAAEGGIGEATVDETTGYITAYAVKQVAGKSSFVNGVAATSITLEEGKNYTVTYRLANAIEFDLNGGEGTTPSTITGNAGDDVTSQMPDGTGISKKNHTFRGWSVNKDATDPDTSFVIDANGTVVYAVWQAKEKVTLTLNANGGTCESASVTTFAGEETELPTAYKAKSVFIGWAESADATTGSFTYTPSEGVTEKTLYAVYKDVGIDVIYVDVKATTNGDGRTSRTPMNDWKKAMAAGSTDGTMYVFMSSATVSETATVGNGYNSAKGPITLTATDPVTGTKYENVYAIFRNNGHYTTKSVTYDMPLISADRNNAMHINFQGKKGHFTKNAIFMPKGYAIPEIDASKNHGFFIRGGNDGGSYASTYMEFDNVDITQAFAVHVCSETGGTIDNANIVINDGTIDKNFLMSSATATIANVIINGYSKQATVKIDKPASCTTLNYILNNNTAEKVTVGTGDNVYIIKSNDGGKVMPTETAGSFEITTTTGEIYVNGTKQEISADNIYALGQAGTYVITYDNLARNTVTYDLNGVEGTAPASYTAKENDSVVLPTLDFAPVGMMFIGWNTDKNADAALESVTMGKEALTLYAIWAEIKHNVTYDANGAEGTVPTAVAVKEGAEIALPTEVQLTKTGFSFLGWNTDKDATEALTSLTMGTTDVTVYAIWKEKVHTVIYNMNGGEGTAPENATVREGNEIVLPTEVAFTKVGHTFLGWAESANATEALTALTMGTADVNLYAVWEPEKYEVTFDANGGKALTTLTALTKTYGVDLTLPTDYVLYGTGIEFAGWSEDPDATADDVVTTYTENKATTFFAIYNEVGTENVTPGTDDTELEDGTYFVITESSETIAQPEFDISGTVTEKAQLDITIIDAATNQSVQPTAPVTFTIHCDDGELSGKIVYVYRVGTNSNEFVASEIDGDDVSFTTASLGTFVVYTLEPEASYVTKGQYNNATGLYTVSLYYNGKQANSGSFGFKYDSTYYTFDEFEYAQGLDAAIDTKHDEDNDVITGTWYPTVGSYIGGNDEDVLIGTFTFACDIADYDKEKAAERFYEYKGDQAIDEIYDGNYYLYAPNASGDLGVVFAPVVTLDVVDAEPITVTYKVSGSLVTVRLDGFTAKYPAKAIITTEAGTTVGGFDIENTSTNTGKVDFEFEMAPGTYKLTVVKNGYLEITKTFTVADTDVEIGDIVPVAGDIRGNTADAQGDGVINLADFVRVIRGFEYPAVAAHVDINEDGAVNVTDLGYVKTNFGSTK